MRGATWHRLFNVAAMCAVALGALTLFLAAAISANAQTYSVLYNFGSNGGNVYGPSVIIPDQDGSFYGTANGGANGDGAVFKITSQGTLTTLYSFPQVGGFPTGLTLGKDGDFYGTTSYFPLQSGTVFKITPGGTFTTLHSFQDLP